MPRIARIVGHGYPHHVVQRGNNKDNVFLDDNDFKAYLELVEKYSEKSESSVLSYCLMTNHSHLLLKPMKGNSLAKMMQGISLCYTQYFNRRYSRTGRLWECRYHSSIIEEDAYLWAVSRYIERNPVRAGMIEKPEDYKYSSGAAHLLGEDSSIIKEAIFEDKERGQYVKFMNDSAGDEQAEDIRRKTRLGHPLGSTEFIEKISKKVGRDLTFRPKGRPRGKERGN
jgi:putative transposase